MARPAFCMVVVAAFLALVVPSTWASDPDPIYDLPTFRTESAFYKTDSLNNMTQGPGGNISRANLETFPALLDQGISYSMFHLAPCGTNVLHSHPRASELQFVIQGAMIAGFVDTTGTVRENLVLQGEAVVYPRGLVHYQQNIGNETAILLSALNSAHPGTLDASNSILLAIEGVAASFGVPTSTITTLRAAKEKVGDGPGLGTPADGSCNRELCSRYTDCTSCDALGLCGWCATSGQCLLGTAAGPAPFLDQSCASWIFNATSCPAAGSSSPITTPEPNALTTPEPNALTTPAGR